MESQRNQESMATDVIMEPISFHGTPYSPSHNKSDSDSGSSHDESHRRPEKALSEQDFDQDEDFQDTFEHDHDYDEEFAQQTKSKKRCTSHKMEPAFSSPTPQYLSSTTPSCKSSSKKKRVCEFCGRSDTPMWRRGPQGKGTLCNACGVKWSLKFRKRAGKKNKESSPSPKDYNDLPNYIEEEYKTPKKSKTTPSGGVSKSQKKSRPKSHSHYDMDDSVPSLNTIPFTSSLSSGVTTSNSMPYRPPNQFQSKFHQDYEYSRESSPPLTPSVGSPLSGTLIEQDFIGGHPNHHSQSITDEESDQVKSTNNYGFSLNPYKASLGKGECNCKSCGISWTSSVFKTFQQFSDHCTHCAEKNQHHNEAQSKTLYDDEYFLEKRFQRMRQVEANRRWDSDSSFDPSANRLLGHLLSVVKDSLLEEQELEEIKKELQHFRQEMRENEASRSFMLDQTQKNLQEDLNQFRTEITNSFTSQHSVVNNKIADAFELLRNETQSLSQNLKEIQRDISQSKVTESIMDISNSPDVTTSADQSILSKIKQLESHLFEMQYKMENTLGQVKSNQLQSIKNLEEKVTQQVEQRKSFVDPNFGNIKKQTNMYFNQLTNQFDQLDAAVNFRKQAV